MRVLNLKFVALPVPEIIGGIPKLWAVPGYAHAPFSQKCLMAFCLDYRPNLKSVALPVPEIISIGVLGRVCNPEILGKRIS